MGDNNIVIKITSEADLDSAQKQMKDLTEQSNRLTEQMEKLKEQEKEDAASIKALGLERAKEAKRLRENANYYKQERAAIKSDIAERKKSIKELENQVKAYKTLNGMSGKAVQQLRAMREELQRMEDAGEFGSQAFMDLAVAAAKLEDQIGDTQQMIRTLSSDTTGLDTAMSVGQGLAGSFYIATSAAEVFGKDLEGLQQAFYKVQAMMSIVSGAQQVYDSMLKKQSIPALLMSRAATGLKNKVEARNAVLQTQLAAVTAGGAVADKVKTVSTNLLTKAQLKLNAAILANPMALVIGAALAVLAGAVYAWMRFSKSMDDSKERAKAMNDELTRSNKLLAMLQKDTDLEISIMQAEGKSEEEVLKKRREANKERIRMAEEAYDSMQKEYSQAKKHTDEMKEALDEANQNLKAAYDEQQSINNEALVMQVRQEHERTEERKRAAEERRNEIKDAERQLQDAVIANMKDGVEKEVAQINLNYDRRIAEIKGNSKAEKALRAELEKQREKEIEKVRDEAAKAELEKLDELARMRQEREVELAKQQTEVLRGDESVEYQKQVWTEFYEVRAQQIKDNADRDAEAVRRNEKDADLAAAKIEKIYADMNAEINANNAEAKQKDLEIDAQYLSSLELAVSKAEDKVSRAQGSGKLDALREQKDAQLALYDEQERQLEAKWKAGVIDYHDYEQQKWEITKAAVDARVQYETDALQTIADGFQTALGYMQQVSDIAFDAINQNIQAELDALDEMYTTDWEEAQKNANKKYITEKEYEKKKAELEEKQAKYAKAQAITNAAIQTALAIVTTLAQLGATPWGIAAAAIAGALGAAQIAVIAAKPLAQYEKGRKGGKGEYAIVGEKGAELMYVPEGASIVPHNKIDQPAEWAKFGVPELPHANPDTLHYAAEQTAIGLSIDYDRLGAAVASALPKQRNVTVNVDRSGVHVSNGGDNHTYLNAKYNGSWS